jgi:hypothetical protein
MIIYLILFFGTLISEVKPEDDGDRDGDSDGELELELEPCLAAITIPAEITKTNARNNIKPALLSSSS